VKPKFFYIRPRAKFYTHGPNRWMGIKVSD